MHSSATRTAGRFDAAEFREQFAAVPVGHRPVVSEANWAARLLLLFAAYQWLQTMWAVNAEYSFDGAVLFTKYVALFWMVAQLVKGEKGIEYFGLAHVYGCLMWGYIAWTTDVRGRFEVPQGPGVDDSNMLGFHLVTGLAFAGMMFIGISGKQRWLAFAAIPLILNAVILTASRSAMIGLVAGGVGCLIFGPPKYRTRLAAAGLLGIVLILMLAKDDIFWQRAGTIPGIGEETKLDDASVARIEAVKGEWRMFLDYPMGAGHRGNEVLSPMYVDKAVLTAEGFRSAHSTIMAALVDHGIPGILIYVSLQFWALKKLFRLRRLGRTANSPLVGVFTGAIAGAFLTFTICGLFLNLIKAEVFIWLLGLITALERVAVEAQPAAPLPQGART